MCDKESKVVEVDDWKRKESERIEKLNEEQEDEERSLNEGE